jgi:hypothetical protein
MGSPVTARRNGNQNRSTAKYAKESLQRMELQMVQERRPDRSLRAAKILS